MASRKTSSRSRTRTSHAKPRAARGMKWSAAVAKRSDALDLKPRIFTSRSARHIALSLKKSADSSRRRKAGPFQSAMSMLNFEINRAGRTLGAAQRRILNNAKNELRKAYGRTAS